MFTGIVEETGTVRKNQVKGCSMTLTIQGDIIFNGLKLGDSVAVNGVCLTVSVLIGKTFVADVMGETMARSTLGSLKVGNKVNLERAIPADGRFGGHIVSGHIDGVGTIANQRQEGNAVWITIETCAAILKYIVEKGSVAVDGISLTVAMVYNHAFAVCVIPHTQAHTILMGKCVGERVHLENDIIGKYVERLIDYRSNMLDNSGGVTVKMMQQAGF